MSKRTEAAPGDYAIGYGKPPRTSQFVKGKSGNPRGRPPKKSPALGGSFGQSDFILEEAGRLYPVREGDQVTMMPAMQAVVRTLCVNGMKGHKQSAIKFIELVQQRQEADQAFQFAQIEEAFRYKAQWEPLFEQCERAGLPPPNQLPHPADVVISPTTGKVRIVGPQDPAEKQVWDMMMKQKVAIAKEMGRYCRLENEDPDNPEYKRKSDELLQEFRMLSALVPEEACRRVYGYDPDAPERLRLVENYEKLVKKRMGKLLKNS